MLPLGGLGEIGKNMTVVEYDGKIVVIDAGVRFPTAEQVGIDLVLPDFSYLKDRAQDIEAIVITHGHEDHLGALPYVIKQLGGARRAPKIYGRPLTMAMGRSKLDEHRLREVELTDVQPGSEINLGTFKIELIHATHSIPDACNVAVTCGAGTMLFTGDYKFDQTPVDGPPADFLRLARFGKEGLLMLLGDSTNVDRPGWSPSESLVGPALYDVFARQRGRIIVTSFASNLHRVQQVIDAAVELNRKVCMLGRSMRKNTNIAKALGILDIPEGVLVQPRDLEHLPDHRVVVMSTGSQGEPLAALRRMAFRDHPQIRIHDGDTVVFSATPIPGNERAVNETIDKLYQAGANVITHKDAPIHASGHGYQEEMKMMLNLTKPKYVMPLHGDYQRLQLHKRLAVSVGVKEDNVFCAENGLPVEIDARGARFGKPVPSGVMYVDGTDIGAPADAALRDRRSLSADGLFVVVATIGDDDGKTVAEPELIFRGVPFKDEADALLEALRDQVDASVERAAADDIHDLDEIQRILHDDVAQLVWEKLKRRPMVLPVVVAV
ncbi:Zn-dependent hydrolase [Patulibacter medicamentivorans]|uniref:Ribonuclease J n=1 Tax=Patulibacter medicamentivorans TaxID=1097667 RepID=H0E1Y7_9ACTN|nr:ribonuclease J [Patulibacter medicamentivorans]EHN12295.1 Zn-dependent hydrolase [Patulibacter medicamentivorans]